MKMGCWIRTNGEGFWFLKSFLEREEESLKARGIFVKVDVDGSYSYLNTLTYSVSPFNFFFFEVFCY